jgi:hypothetical protein
LTVTELLHTTLPSKLIHVINSFKNVEERNIMDWTATCQL